MRLASTRHRPFGVVWGLAATILAVCGVTPLPAGQAVDPPLMEKLRERARLGEAEAQFHLGFAYEKGNGTPRDVAEAIKWYKLAAEQGYADAQLKLGILYDLGDDVPKDPVEAVKWFKLGAAQGDTRAQTLLGEAYRDGKGVPGDRAEAVKWFSLAAQRGNASGQLSLGLMYFKGDGVPKDAAEAVKWFKAAAGQGDVGAQRRLGLIYYLGIEVSKDATEAARWFKLAAEQDDVFAQYQLGRLYCIGEGIHKSATEAVKWFKLASEHGSADAQYTLALMYINGDGVPKDAAEAVKWFRLAAEQGNALAQSGLGLAYARGDGVPKDYVRAYAWSNLAAAGGIEDAARTRDVVAAEMTPAQIAEAQRISAEFRPKHQKPDRRQQADLAPAERADATGSGFFITDDGYFVTNHHVIAEARRISVRTAAGTFPATVVRVDASNDLAILKVQGKFSALYVYGSRALKLADRVATVGFPNPGLQGLAAKYSSGEVAALSGPGDDPRFLQMSVPIQPGNSGGPLVDSSGRVIGVVVSQLDKVETLKVTGNLPENVNYAIKGTLLLGVLEALPGLGERLKSDPKAPPKDAAEVAKAVEAACGMVLVEK